VTAAGDFIRFSWSWQQIIHQLAVGSEPVYALCYSLAQASACSLTVSAFVACLQWNSAACFGPHAQMVMVVSVAMFCHHNIGMLDTGSKPT
jgi:hypothetical protein